MLQEDGYSKKGRTYEGMAKLLLAGALSVALALCWDWFFPINKKLWTGSFVLITVGIDCILLAALIYIIDFSQKHKWTYFFEVFGKNPLFIYLLSELGVTLLWFIPVGPNHQPILPLVISKHLCPRRGIFWFFSFCDECYAILLAGRLYS